MTPRTNILVIRHRCNSIADLAATDTYYGVEIDIRTKDKTLLLAHDPFSPGESFSDWIEHYRHRFIVLNVKEEGLEEAVLGVLGRHGVEDFFFLDQSFPFLLKTAAGGERRCAVRTSESGNTESMSTRTFLSSMSWAMRPSCSLLG